RTWQLEITLRGTGKTLLARGAALPGATGGGYVLVFDDITQLIQAQRATAWAEVARRLAHEIKNPLTPIQLSAERLEMKLADRLAGDDAATLRRNTQTIVNQVTALKSMVDDFGDYARLPAPVPAGFDLNALVADVLALYENSRVPIAKRLAPALPPVWADTAQIRQVIHNLVQNAQDALENRKEPRQLPAIEVCTELAGDKVRLSVADNGDGFPEELMARIFEPYVTTKPRGTGLGLAIVKKIVDEHHGSIAIENRPERGASVSVLLPLAEAA
ncbi:MAG: ATP-binding protein, partial [Burkholderiales bacterium]